MAAANNRKIVIAGIAAVALLVLVVVLVSSLGSDSGGRTARPNQPGVHDAESTFDEGASSVATRSTPSEGLSRGGRLGGASDEVSGADDATRDDGAVKKKTKRPKKRGRSRKKRSDQSEEEDENKGAGKRKVIPRPF